MNNPNKIPSRWNETPHDLILYKRVLLQQAEVAMLSSTPAKVPRFPKNKKGRENKKSWKLYLSRHRWGTIREVYNKDNKVWDCLSHDHVRLNFYRSSKKETAGINNNQQFLYFILSLWKSNDSILKDRLFGLANRMDNFGKDVRGYCYYPDNIPTHSHQSPSTNIPSTPFPTEYWFMPIKIGGAASQPIGSGRAKLNQIFMVSQTLINQK